MKVERFKDEFVSITSFLLIILFLYTGLSKLIDHNKFVIVLNATGLLVGSSGKIIAVAVPVIECIIAFLLIVPKFRTTGLVLSTVLMCFFSIYIAWMLITQEKLPCSCGGVIGMMTWSEHLVFNFCFTLIAAISTWLQISKQFFIAINRRSRTPV